MDYSILHFFNGNGNVFLDGFALTLTNGLTWIPLYVTLFLLVVKNNKTMGQVGLICLSAFCCVLLSGIFSDVIVKPMTARIRPINDPLIMYSLTLVDGVSQSGYSFFSSHAANTFSIAVFFSLLVRSTLMSVTLFTWSLLNAWTRLYLAVHYPSDVVVGILWGAVVGVLVYFVFYRIYYSTSTKNAFVTSHYTSSGYDTKDIDVCISVACLTLLFAIVASVAMA